MTQSVRLKFLENMTIARDVVRQEQHDPLYGGFIGPEAGRIRRGMLDERTLEAIDHNYPYFEGVVNDVERAKTIVFPAEQVLIFLDLLKNIDFDLDYILPFPSVFMQFSKPIEIHNTHQISPGCAGALLLTRYEEFNNALLIDKDLWDFRPVFWGDGAPDGDLDDEPGFVGLNALSSLDIKRLAIACIGYVNCENVYLYPIESPSPAINAKRERKGKSRLEPYYVCRIRGVQYDSAGNPTGEGAKHGIRYDVRGHFRRMTDGKTTWVRPHQRGLSNELYVPKTYLVDKVTA